MKRPLTYLLITFSVIFWGISFILTKELFLTEEHLSVTLLIAMRLALATAVMLPILALSGKLQPIRRGPGKGLKALLGGDLKWFLLLALCEPFIYHLCETSGVQLVSGSLASVIVATIPLFVPFGMWIAYRQPIRLPLAIGVILSLLGVGVMLSSELGLTPSGVAAAAEEAAPQAAGSMFKGLLFLCGAVIIAVVYTLLLVKVVDRYNPLVITTWQNLIGFLYFLPLVLAFDGGDIAMLSFSPRMIGLLLVLGICCSTLAYAGYNYGVRNLGASEACIFNNAIPVFSLLAAVAIGQEQFGWMKVIGLIVTVAGVVIAQIPSRK